jgi:hypothetical protein
VSSREGAAGGDNDAEAGRENVEIKEKSGQRKEGGEANGAGAIATGPVVFVTNVRTGRGRR